MYRIIEVNGKLHIQDQEGILVKRNERLVWFAGPIGAKKELVRLNSGKKLSTSKIRGVVDNRHRNWKMRLS